MIIFHLGNPEIMKVPRDYGAGIESHESSNHEIVRTKGVLDIFAEDFARIPCNTDRSFVKRFQETFQLRHF